MKNVDIVEPSDLAALAEGVDQRLAALEGRVDALEARVAALETPPAPPREPLVLGVQYTAMWGGVTDADREAMADAIAATGAGWVRFDVAWATMQPTATSWDTGWGVPTIERCIDIARARGLKVLLMVYWAPEWATPGTGKAAAPNPGDYGKALEWIAARFRGKVDAYEIWNEQNGSRFLNPPDPAVYTGLLKAGYAGVKASDPDALVVMGGLEYVDTDFLTRMYAAGALGHYDVAACHPYPAIANQSPDESVGSNKWSISHFDEWLRVMEAHGDTAPVWFTEFGWATHSNTSTTPNWSLGVTDQQQADYLYRMVEMTRDRWPRVEGLFWYTVRDTNLGDIQQDSYGLVRRDWSRKPSHAALTRAVADFGR